MNPQGESTSYSVDSPRQESSSYNLEFPALLLKEVSSLPWIGTSASNSDWSRIDALEKVTNARIDALEKVFHAHTKQLNDHEKQLNDHEKLLLNFMEQDMVIVAAEILK